MNQVKKIGLIILFCLGFCLTMQAQQAQDLLDAPFIESVSVDPFDPRGEVTITWSMPTPQVSLYDVEEFELYFWGEEIIGAPTYIPFETGIHYAERSFTFFYEDIKSLFPNMPNPKETSVRYNIKAVNQTHNKSSLMAIFHRNTQITSSFDQCSSEITLNWQRYLGWSSSYYNSLDDKFNFSHYNLWGIKDGIEWKIGEFSSNILTHTMKNVETKSEYTFYIIAERNDGLTAKSYSTVIETYMPDPPAYIHALSVQYNEQGLAEIRFIIDPDTETHTFDFFGTGNLNVPLLINTIDIHGSDITLTDIQARNRTYYYHLEAKHVCSEQSNVAESNPATALWLTAVQDGLVNTLR